VKLLPDSLAAQTIAVLFVGLMSFHVASVWIYEAELDSDARGLLDAHTLEHVLTAVRAVAARPPEERAATAQALSDERLHVAYGRDPSVARSTLTRGQAEGLGRALAELAPPRPGDWLRAAVPGDGAGPEGRPPPVLVSVALPDGGWLNLRSARRAGPASHADLVRSTSAMALGVLLVSVALVRSLTRPFRVLADAARRLGADVAAPPVPERGPRELREAAAAFNEMQRRIGRLIQDRTQTLAAISHDLKTPITRIRLRAEFVDDAELHAKLLADLDEMEAMLDSTLAFLRGDATGEPSVRVDLAATLQAICEDKVDAGHDAAFSGPPHATFLGRPLALKRAFTNLVENAVRYGGRARVVLETGDREYRVHVEDDGPGIDPALHEAVFAPFYRVEGSRGRATGGTGLGLTVARAIARSHGGEVLLRNAAGAGLRATVLLPLAPHQETPRSAESPSTPAAAGPFRRLARAVSARGGGAT
jgi:signal transduction histidine kinase